MPTIFNTKAQKFVVEQKIISSETDNLQILTKNWVEKIFIKVLSEPLHKITVFLVLNWTKSQNELMK